MTKSGDYIDIRGKTSPNTTVHLWFQKGDAEPSLSDTLSDASGNFTFFSETPVDAGTYHIWATALRNGSESARSQIATVKVENVGLVAAAQTGADFIATMIPFLAATVLAGLGIGYVFHRKKMEEKAPLR